MSRSRVLTTAIIGLTGAVIGSFSMMLYAGSHFTRSADPGKTFPEVSAAPLPAGGSDQDRIVRAVRRVEPSVVALNVVVNGTQVVPVDPFSQIFGGGTGENIIRRFHQRASGSGFVYGANGLIVTNAHVVENASSISVVFQNGDHVTGHLFADDLGTDVALVKVDNYAKLPPPLALGDSSKLSQGQWAIAIGEPLELKQTVTVGVVSAFNRDETIGSEGGGFARQFKGLLQTSAAINPGNSGGPLIDTEGRLIGVNQSTASPQYAQGIGFAIPVNTVRASIAELIQHPGMHTGQSSGFIGVELAALDGNVRHQLNYLGSGAAIAGVVSGSAADAAGLEPGDVIQQINGSDVHRPEDVTHAIGNMRPGQTATMTIWSGGTQKHITIKVGRRPVSE
jgi:serine protease Do